MAKPVSETATKDNVIIWQEVEDGEGMPEPALLLEFYGDTFSINQGGKSISLNYETIDHLSKIMKDAKARIK